MPGDNVYNDAFPLTQSLSVSKATLTVIGFNTSRIYKQPLLGTYAYQIAGLVSGDTYNVLDSLPLVATSAVLTSDVGNYPVIFSGARDKNYTFNYLNGTLTIAKSPQTLSGFNQLTKVQTGETITLTGNAQSGLPITITIQDPSIVNAQGSAISGLKDGITTGTISQNGDKNYLPSPSAIITIVSTSTGVAATLLGIIGKETVAGGTSEKYKVPVKPGYTYTWKYTGSGVVFLQNDATSAQIEIFFTENATNGNLEVKFFDVNKNLVKTDAISIIVNFDPQSAQGQDLKEPSCEGAVINCTKSFINNFKISKLENLNSGCSKSGYGLRTRLWFRQSPGQ